MGDQLRDGDHPQAVAPRVGDQVTDPGHGAVLVEDLADDPGGERSGHTREVDRRLGVAGALEHPAGARAQREHVSGLDEILGAAARIDGGLHGACAVVCGDAGGDAVARLDGDGEGGPVQRLVAARHRPQAELVAALGAERQADQPACLAGHEVDRLGRGELRGHHQVALVLPVLAIADDHHAPVADVRESVLDGVERRGHRARPCGVAVMQTRMVAAGAAVK